MLSSNNLWCYTIQRNKNKANLLKIFLGRRVPFNRSIKWRWNSKTHQILKMYKPIKCFTSEVATINAKQTNKRVWIYSKIKIIHAPVDLGNDDERYPVVMATVVVSDAAVVWLEWLVPLTSSEGYCCSMHSSVFQSLPHVVHGRPYTILPSDLMR